MKSSATKHKVKRRKKEKRMFALTYLLEEMSDFAQIYVWTKYAVNLRYVVRVKIQNYPVSNIEILHPVLNQNRI